jgi:hypothetical protein
VEGSVRHAVLTCCQIGVGKRRAVPPSATHRRNHSNAGKDTWTWEPKW